MRKGIIIITGIIVYLFSISANAAAIEVAPKPALESFNRGITDREIIEKLSALDAKIDKVHIEIRAEIKGLQQQIAELKDGQKVLEGRIDTLIYAALGCFVTLIGFVIWDRRTAISPAIRKNKELEEEQEKIKREFQEEQNKV